MNLQSMSLCDPEVKGSVIDFKRSHTAGTHPTLILVTTAIMPCTKHRACSMPSRADAARRTLQDRTGLFVSMPPLHGHVAVLQCLRAMPQPQMLDSSTSCSAGSSSRILASALPAASVSSALGSSSS